MNPIEYDEDTDSMRQRIDWELKGSSATLVDAIDSKGEAQHMVAMTLKLADLRTDADPPPIVEQLIICRPDRLKELGLLLVRAAETAAAQESPKANPH